MDKILFDVVDVNVAGTYVYVDNGVAYIDSEFEKPFSTKALKNVFLKGAVIVVSDDLYKPISFALNDSDVGVVTYVTPDDTTVTTAVLATASAVDEEVEEVEEVEEE